MTYVEVLHETVDATENAVSDGSENVVTTTQRSNERTESLDGCDDHAAQADRTERGGDGTAQD